MLHAKQELHVPSREEVSSLGNWAMLEADAKRRLRLAKIMNTNRISVILLFLRILRRYECLILIHMRKL